MTNETTISMETIKSIAEKMEIFDINEYEAKIIRDILVKPTEKLLEIAISASICLYATQVAFNAGIGDYDIWKTPMIASDVMKKLWGIQNGSNAEPH